LKLLNKKKAYLEKSYWQFVNIVLPLIVLLAFGAVFQYLRKRKYS